MKQVSRGKIHYCDNLLDLSPLRNNGWQAMYDRKGMKGQVTVVWQCPNTGKRYSTDKALEFAQKGKQ